MNNTLMSSNPDALKKEAFNNKSRPVHIRKPNDPEQYYPQRPCFWC